MAITLLGKNCIIHVEIVFKQVADSAKIARTPGNFEKCIFMSQIGHKLKSTHGHCIYRKKNI